MGYRSHVVSISSFWKCASTLPSYFSKNDLKGETVIINVVLITSFYVLHLGIMITLIWDAAEIDAQF